MSDAKTAEQNGVGEPPVKTEKQLKKEAEKAAKLEKLKQKLEKKNAAPAQPKEKPDVRMKKIQLICLTYTYIYVPAQVSILSCTNLVVTKFVQLFSAELFL